MKNINFTCPFCSLLCDDIQLETKNNNLKPLNTSCPLLLSSLKREIKEELDIEICNAKNLGIIYHQYSHMKLHITLIKCHYKSGIAKSLSSQEIKWITYNEKKYFRFNK